MLINSIKCLYVTIFHSSFLTKDRTLAREREMELESVRNKDFNGVSFIQIQGCVNF